MSFLPIWAAWSYGQILGKHKVLMVSHTGFMVSLSLYVRAFPSTRAAPSMLSYLSGAALKPVGMASVGKAQPSGLPRPSTPSTCDLRGILRRIKSYCLWPSCCCLVAQLCPTRCDPVDCSPPGSPDHGISQARVLEWDVISFSRGSSWPRDRTCVSCIGRRMLYHGATGEVHLYPWPAH